MKKLLLVIGVFLCSWEINAVVVPEIWYCPDSLVSLQQEDSISWTDEYTIFTVVRSLNDSVAECLWSFAENDTVSAAVLTKGVYTPATGKLLSRNPHDFSRWCVYAYHSGIYADSTKRRTLRTGEQIVYVDSVTTDTLHAQVEIEEMAYFHGNVPKLVSDAFQTYLALKYGVTLDYAPYISQLGDTLWHPEYDEAFYHRVQGIGNDTICDWSGYVSRSKEDAFFCIRTDSLSPNEYILVGDNGGSLEWHSEADNKRVVERGWRMRQYVVQPKASTLVLRLSALEEADSLHLLLTDAENNTLQTLMPDSIVHDSLCFFTLNRTEPLLHFQLQGVLPPQAYKSPSQTSTESEENIFFDANNQMIVISGYPENQVFTLYLHDSVGKCLASVSSLNPIDVKLFPSMVSYIEIMADNQTVGAITIPIIIY